MPLRNVCGHQGTDVEVPLLLLSYTLGTIFLLLLTFISASCQVSMATYFTFLWLEGRLGSATRGKRALGNLGKALGRTSTALRVLACRHEIFHSLILSSQNC